MAKNLNEYYEKTYTEVASSYDHSRYAGPKREFSKSSRNDIFISVLSEFGIQKNSPITDVASGTGRVVHCLLQNGFTKITATDLTQAMLDVSKKNLPEGTSQFINYHCADMKKLPLPDNSADVITVGKFFYLIPKDEYDDYMTDVKRVLKNDGLLICEISNALHLFNPFSFLKTFFMKNLFGKKIMSYAYFWELKKIFSKFQLLNVIGIDFPFFLVKNYSSLKKINKIPLLGILGGSFIVVYRLKK